MTEKKALYIFIDESGNFDFATNKGSKHLILTALTCLRPFNGASDLRKYKYDLLEMGHEIEYFHSSHDKNHVKKKVYEIIEENIHSYKIDSIIAEKAKAHPFVRDDKRFYPNMLKYLLKYILRREKCNAEQVIIITDVIPVNKKRTIIEKAIKITLARELPKGIKYTILHHSSKSHAGLQIADYCCWAIQRKWVKGEDKAYNVIKGSIKSEFDIYKSGETYYD